MSLYLSSFLSSQQNVQVKRACWNGKCLSWIPSVSLFDNNMLARSNLYAMFRYKRKSIISDNAWRAIISFARSAYKLNLGCMLFSIVIGIVYRLSQHEIYNIYPVPTEEGLSITYTLKNSIPPLSLSSLEGHARTLFCWVLFLGQLKEEL